MLSARERQGVTLITNCFFNTDIADRLDISEKIVRNLPGLLRQARRMIPAPVIVFAGDLGFTYVTIR